MVANSYEWKIFKQIATEVYKDIFDVSMYKIYNTVERVIFTVINWEVKIMKKDYTKPVLVFDDFSNTDNTNLAYVSQVIAPISGGLSSKITKLNSW